MGNQKISRNRFFYAHGNAWIFFIVLLAVVICSWTGSGFATRRTSTPWVEPTRSLPITTTIPEGTDIPLSSYLLEGNLQPITETNISDIQPLARLGMGVLKDVLWTGDGRVVFLTGAGIFFYDEETLQELFSIPSEAEIHCGSLSPDGNTLATGLSDGRLQLFNASDGTLMHTLAGHEEYVHKVAFSPDGSRLVSGSSSDSVIKTWQVSDGRNLTESLIDHRYLLQIAFSENGKRTLSAWSDGALIVQDSEKGTVLRTITGLWKNASAVEFSPDGKLAASSEEDGYIRIWQTDSGAMLRVIMNQNEKFQGISFSPYGTMLAAGGYYKGVYLLRVSDGKLIDTMDHSDMVINTSFSRDGELLAAWESGGTINFWQVADGLLKGKVKTNATLGAVLLFSPDRSLLVSADAGGLRIWRMEDLSLKEEIPGSYNAPNCVALSPDGSLLVYADFSLILRRLSDGAEIWTLPIYAQSVAFSPDGRLLAVGAQGVLYMVDVENGSIVDTLEGFEGWVISIAFSPDGSRIAIGAMDNEIRIFRSPQWQWERTIITEMEWIWKLVFSPDGEILASKTTGENSVSLWNVADGTLFRSLSLRNNEPSFSFSPDGSCMITGADDGSLMLWRISDGRQLSIFRMQTLAVNRVEFSHDGILLASSSLDGTICLWGIPNDG